MRLILGILSLVIMFSQEGASQESKTLQGIAFGLSRGKVKMLNLNDLSVMSFATEVSKRAFTEEIEYFPDAETLVFSVYNDDLSRKIGKISVPTGEVTYWDPNEIGLGRYVLAPALSNSFANRIYGRFSETPLKNFQRREEAEKFDAATRIGAFDVMTGTWEEVSHDSKPDWTWFDDTIYTLRPDWGERFQPVWEALLNQKLLTYGDMHDLFWADDRYVFFRSEKTFVLGLRNADDTITLVQKIPITVVPEQIDSVAFVYSSSSSHSKAPKEYMLVSAFEDAAPAQPCRIFQINIKESTLDVLFEIVPQRGQGIRLVAAYQQLRSLALWQSEEQQQGSVLLMDIDHLERRHLAHLPFRPIFGGHLMNTEDSGLTAVA